MAKWIAIILIWLATISVADDLHRATVRIGAIERRTCTLIAVNTPNGVASVCAAQ